MIRPLRFLHQKIPVVTQLGFFALAFACQLRVWVCLRFVRLVGSLFPMEVCCRIARIVRRNRMIVILSLKTLDTRPRLQQRSIHCEVLVGEQIPLSCLLEHSLEEGLSNIPIEQPVAVLGEHGHVPDGVIHI
jgi:hypothetical protein